MAASKKMLKSCWQQIALTFDSFDVWHFGIWQFWLMTFWHLTVLTCDILTFHSFDVWHFDIWLRPRIFQEEETAATERERQLRLDEELARELEAEENAATLRRVFDVRLRQFERDEAVALAIGVTDDNDDSVAEVDVDESVLDVSGNLDDSNNSYEDIEDDE